MAKCVSCEQPTLGTKPLAHGADRLLKAVPFLLLFDLGIRLADHSLFSRTHARLSVGALALPCRPTPARGLFRHSFAAKFVIP